MGRFAHEAVAVDPRDRHSLRDRGQRSDEPALNRFLPADPTDLLAGGRLQMLAIKDQPGFNTYEGVERPRREPAAGHVGGHPGPRPGGRSRAARCSTRAGPPVEQPSRGSRAAGSTAAACSSTRRAAATPEPGRSGSTGRAAASGGQLILVFESPSAEVLDAPDNITVSPRGGLVLCEDGGGEQYVRGLDERGRIFDLALNLMEGDNEFAGACFSPDGSVMFVNVQTPGVSFAIRGPWEKGAI